jgi:ubiquinone/menaquinone biosynthesis C-methylase UbiE
MSGMLERWGYGLSQSARVAWYMGHYLAALRFDAKEEGPRPDPAAAREGQRALIRALRELFAQDWRNIEDGVYAMPHDLVGRPGTLLDRSRRFFRDVPGLAARRAAREGQELRAKMPETLYPSYYLQNFHYQTDGYLSPESAALYDFQVETLFSGGADAMRRQALVPLREALMGRDQRDLSLLDVACGTGRFLAFVKDNYPRLQIAGLDLSTDYLVEAGRALERWRGADLFRANAEAIPLADGSQDLVTCIFLFHELPPPVRRIIAREMARVLKPGGLLIFEDSLQTGDAPDYDRLLESFPQRFHEPYFRSYLGEDLSALFAEAGLTLEETRTAFLAKVCVFRK